MLWRTKYRENAMKPTWVICIMVLSRSLTQQLGTELNEMSKLGLQTIWFLTPLFNIHIGYSPFCARGKSLPESFENVPIKLDEVVFVLVMSWWKSWWRSSHENRKSIIASFLSSQGTTWFVFYFAWPLSIAFYVLWQWSHACSFLLPYVYLRWVM